VGGHSGTLMMVDDDDYDDGDDDNDDDIGVAHAAIQELHP